MQSRRSSIPSYWEDFHTKIKLIIEVERFLYEAIGFVKCFLSIPGNKEKHDEEIAKEIMYSEYYRLSLARNFEEILFLAMSEVNEMIVSDPFEARVVNIAHALFMEIGNEHIMKKK